MYINAICTLPKALQIGEFYAYRIIQILGILAKIWNFPFLQLSRFKNLGPYEFSQI